MSSTRGKKITKTVAFITLTIVCILMLLPIVWGVFGSFRRSGDFTSYPASFFPSKWDAFTLDGYRELFSKTEYIPTHSNEYFPIWNWLFNSLIVAIGGTLLYLIIASFAAYAFAFLDFKYHDKIFYFLIGTMTIPGIISTTPQLINMNMLGAYKSILGLILPGLGGVYGVFLIKQFFSNIPKDLIENARMDGASNMRIFFNVVLPLGKSALFVQGLFGFMGAWNDVQWAQLIIGNAPRTTWTLAYGLKVISDNSESYEATTLVLASAVIAMIPILIVFLIAQSKIIEGVASTGIKR
ncbi:MAG TPA: carbohydrate ABC transporter permease [Candidatus Paceibacterota bacterium]|nr:carbohydrate ABC transporter permease [Candidatus Paceibacterota bacterium]